MGIFGKDQERSFPKHKYGTFNFLFYYFIGIKYLDPLNYIINSKEILKNVVYLKNFPR
jgi:hypothetical protein